MLYKLKPNVFGNIDFGQDPNKKPYGVKIYTLSDQTIDGLRQKVYEWQGDNNIGGGNWGTCKVFKDNTLLGFMSYNGRIWDKEVWSANAKEIKE